MTKTITEDRARGGRWIWHSFHMPIAALILAFIAWGVAEIHVELIKSPTTQEDS
jgi:glucan phosphorylase